MLDVLPIGKLYDKYFNFTKTDPVNLNFEAIGFESTNFLKNIGSMVLALCLIFLLSISVVVLYYFRKFKFYKKLTGMLFCKFPITFIIDQCSTLILCSFMNFTKVSFYCLYSIVNILYTLGWHFFGYRYHLWFSYCVKSIYYRYCYVQEV